MSKLRRRRKRKKDEASLGLGTSWLESDGLHALIPGADPSPEAFEEASRIYQKNIRNSPLWDQMVRQFGEAEAERLLLECRVERR